MVRLDVDHPLIPIPVRDRQVIGQNIQCQNFKPVQDLNRDIGNGVPKIEVSLARLEKRKDNIPRLVAERVIVQPLICKHTPKDKQAERGIEFQRISFIAVNVAKEALTETHLLPILQTKVRRVKINGQVNNVPE